MVSQSSPLLNGDRLIARLERLAVISAPGDGVTRLAYSDEDKAARQLVGLWMAEAGLQVEMDAATNLIGSRTGSDVCLGALSTGSHLDTVINAGALDGAYGVVAAIEVAASLMNTPLRHSLRVVAFSNEEGARGTPGMFGSLVISDGYDLSDLDKVDAEGISLRERIQLSGGTPNALAEAAWGENAVAAHVELHIEQGPVLADSDLPIGIVRAITGQRQLEIEVKGCANHAGTTPMSTRQDALVAAAQIVLEVKALTRGGTQNYGVITVATVGRLKVEPSVRNVVPGRAVLSVDLRDPDTQRLNTAIEILETALSVIGERSNTEIYMRQVQEVEATLCHSSIIAAIKQATRDLGKDSMVLVSGASHDSQSMAKIGPVGMIFVPSVNGLSHTPDESSLPIHLVGGAEVLLHTLINLDKDL